MFDLNVKIIQELQAFLHLCSSDAALLSLFRRSPGDFTRLRKLSFPRLVLFIAKLCKKTLSVELDAFFMQDLQQTCSCSVSAFSQQRQKLKSSFFAVWNQVLCSSFYFYGSHCVRRWHGYRLLAGDGTAVSLTGIKALQLHFGGQRNAQGAFCGAKAFFHYDVLNKLFVYSHLDTYRTSEHHMAYGAVDTLPPDSLTLYDRNFCCYKLMALHRWSEQERRFVIRAREHHRFVADFLRRGVRSAEVDIFPTAQAIRELRKSGFLLTRTTALRVRLIRVDLPGGGVEVLLTNLWEAEGYAAEEFGPLYFLRWGIETAIALKKNLLQLESFSGLSVAAVEQDFYATVLVANLEALISRQAEEERMLQTQNRKQAAQPVKTAKYPLQVNHNKASGKLRQWLVTLLLKQQPHTVLQLLTTYFQKHLLPVRKGRRFKRKRVHKQSFSKHKTYSNFKPAI